MEQNTLCFKFKDTKPIRVRMYGGEPWFLAADIFDALGITQGREMVKNNLFDDERRRELLSVSFSYRGKMHSANRWVTFVNESGLYTLIMRSNKREAKEFRHWVTSEVLPSINKTGRYEMPNVEPQKLLDVSSEAAEQSTLGLQAMLTLSGSMSDIAELFKRLQI